LAGSKNIKEILSITATPYSQDESWEWHLPVGSNCSPAATIIITPNKHLPFLGGSAPNFLGKTWQNYKDFFHVSEALKDKNNHHNHPGPAWVCFALLPLVSWAQGRRNWEATGTLGWKA